MIEVEHLSKIYGSTTAISDVDFTVEKGEILGFLGPNGAGKTTTMRILSGYIPATTGTARIAGYDGSTNSTMVGTVKWKIKDDKGKIHNFVLPNTYYSPSVETRLLSPQHWHKTTVPVPFYRDILPPSSFCGRIGMRGGARGGVLTTGQSPPKPPLS